MISVEKWHQQGEYFQYEGNNIFFCKSGNREKPKLLLIHGFPTSSWDWHFLWPELSKHFHLFTMDMIGFGFSDKPEGFDYTTKYQADLFEFFLARENLSDYHILAHDYGDTVAQELLARDLDNERETVRSVLLLNGGLFPETAKPILLQKLLMTPLGKIIARLTTYKKFKKNFNHICHQSIPEDILSGFWELMNHNNGVAAIPRLIRYMKERTVFRSRWLGALQNSTCPIRFINGLEDPISGKHMVTRYKQLIANADVVELQDVGHYPQVEAPKSILDGATDFWRKHNIPA
ncbi:alpha/beta fold hydrolase [Aliikangiella coralliicola]|uniref:Alpha/beta hydrolase n=1 Tax=Aliikangiella coralliicola TaxID=2592383 RepID=A0A545U7P5_9GAMM|nr:alpha/beta hydrolase [Aliikangiella coralliicola]TQV85492.1 alpha/beta hydrolase [Aliikangiella coralliicola]